MLWEKVLVSGIASIKGLDDVKKTWFFSISLFCLQLYGFHYCVPFVNKMVMEVPAPASFRFPIQRGKVNPLA